VTTTTHREPEDSGVLPADRDRLRSEAIVHKLGAAPGN
jgi:hypothetical protein